ncbi:neprilysin-2-like isoform X2 [Stegodyphus dumicola]|uniref:neprilysin-2-like isoform X2 n=1 Tax=Stegodyphus dumicola TaxID=202533 RepID=UPI0015B375A1|nr:neprilysin-2-like isoform X2 [Stegodyphus dumicola]
MASKRGCKEWFQERTNFEKTLLSLSSVLLLTLCLVILFGIAYKGSKMECFSEKEDVVCRSRNCIITAGQILSKMNYDVDPCSNFYKFACGRYGSETGQVDSVAQSSVDYVYFALKSGLKNEFSYSIETVHSLLLQFGIDTWPVIDIFYDEDTNLSVEERLVGLNLVGIPVVFQLEVITEDNVPDSHILKLSPGGPQDTSRSPEDIRSDQRLRSRMISFFLFIGASESRARKAASDILATESHFADIYWEKDQKRCTGSHILSSEESVSELNRFIPELNWTKVMNVFWKATGIARPYTMKLYCKEKIRDYMTRLLQNRNRSCYNYLGWRFIAQFSRHIEPSFRFRLDPAIPRWKECISLLEQFASPFLAEALKKTEIKQEIQDTVEKVSSSIFSSIDRLLSKTKWMSSKIKNQFLQKVNMMDLRFPFRKEENISRTLLFKTSEIEPENYSGIVINLYRQVIIEKLKKLTPTKDTVEIIEPGEFQLTSEISVSGNRSVVFAFFDKIREPYIRIYGPEALSYGGFGTFIAKTISRILIREDPATHLNDETHLLGVWSSNTNISSCLINFIADRLPISEESLSDVRELFLDQSSLEIAYESLKSRTEDEKKALPGLDMSEEQMFFLAYAQTMCGEESQLNKNLYVPTEDRLNAVVYNSKAFSEAYKCNSSFKQCEFWT